MAEIEDRKAKSRAHVAAGKGPVPPTPRRRLSEMTEMLDLRADNITENVVAINSGCDNPRLKFIMQKLVEHSHNFIKETGISTDEWMGAIQFLTQTGQMCSDIRQEFILLSDIFGISALVDTMNNPKPKEATESTVLGPFLTADADHFEKGESIASEGAGEYLLVKGRVTDMTGKPVAGAEIETWETDQFGFYDTQYEDRSKPDCRGILTSDKDGYYQFRAVTPVSYPIPNDGPVGKLLDKLGRHVFRPAHLHLKVEAKGYETLITAFYPVGDKYLKSDAVFGVKSSLVIDIRELQPADQAQQHGFADARPFRLLNQDLILITPDQAERERRETMPAYFETQQ